MGNNKTETFKKLKNIKSVPEKLKEELKIFNNQKRLIRKTLLTKSGSVPMIAKESGIDPDTVIYVLMSMLKFDEVEVDKVDDMDEFFLYRLRTENKNGKN